MKRRGGSGEGIPAFIQRCYIPAAENVRKSPYPPWDYRSHRDPDRRSLSSTNSSFSSDGTGTAFYSSLDSSSGSCDIPPDLIPGTYNSTKHRPVGGVSVRLSVHPRERKTITDCYQRILNWIKPECPLVSVDASYTCKPRIGQHGTRDVTSHCPSLAVVVFIKEAGLFASKRLHTAAKYFDSSHWCLHHTESLNKTGFRASDDNKLQYFALSRDLPLCAYRVAHSGKELIRFTRFVSEENWDDMVDLYKLIIGHQPILQRPHFQLFLISSAPFYDVQFALKRHHRPVPPPSSMRVKHSDSVVVEFNITGGIGALVPLLPHVCTQQSDTNRWQTIDHDGNRLQFNVINRSRSRSIGSLSTPRCRQNISVLSSPTSLGFFV